MDAAVYSRLSRKRKRRRDKESVEVQIAESLGYAKHKRLTIVIDPKLTSDNDISASKYSKKPRPGYERLIEAIAANQVEVVICTEMSRLYRRMEELLDLIRMAERTRLKEIVETDGRRFDLSTADGIHAAIAEVNNAIRESNKISERQKRMKAEDAREGLPNGGGRPYGFEEDQVTLRPSEVANLIEAKDRYLAGETVRDVVRDFYARGVLSPYGKPWQIENFTRVLFNKRYLGIRVHNGVEYPAVWPAIFTQAEWDRMNARRLSRAAKWPGRGRGVGRKYLLTGLCVCGLCGGYMVGSRKQSGQGPIRRYKCRRVDNYGNTIGCGRVFRAADPLEAWITEAVLYRFDSPEVNLALAEPEEPDRTDELVQAYNEARDNLDQMVADYASRLLTREQFALAKTVAEGQVEAAMTALSRYQRRNINIQLPEPGMMREVWETAGMDWKHQVIKLLVEKIEILPGHPGSHMWRSWRFSPELVRVSWRVLAKAAGRWLICRPVFRFYPAQLCWL